MTARQTLLDGLARDADIFELVSELAPSHLRNNTFPGEVFLHLAGEALDWCGASRSGPLLLEGLGGRFLPECTFRGRQNKKFQYSVLAAAALHGGTEPDLLDEVAWWQIYDFWHPVRGGLLHPRRRQPGGRAGASGMSGPGRAPCPPSAISDPFRRLRKRACDGGAIDHRIGGDVLRSSPVPAQIARPRLGLDPDASGVAMTVRWTGVWVGRR